MSVWEMGGFWHTPLTEAEWQAMCEPYKTTDMERGVVMLKARKHTSREIKKLASGEETCQAVVRLSDTRAICAAGASSLALRGISGRAAANGLAAMRRECPRNLTPRGERAV